MENTRIESDSLGEVDVPADKLWGAQTQRSLQHFSIGLDHMPLEVMHALCLIKKAAALTNCKLNKLSEDKAKLIIAAAEEALSGALDTHFPLYVWMTGSGTQANMNVNEVIANRANQMAGQPLGSKNPIHPNDHVNMSQSSNDTFPTAMHIAAVKAFRQMLLPSVQELRNALDQKAQDWAKIVKIGRTHLEDAVPITLGEEFSGYVGMLDDDLKNIESVLPELYRLAIGGTAVGTGLNTAQGFGTEAAQQISGLTGLPFISASNKFAIMGSHDGIIRASGALKVLACSLYKIANDIRLLSSGPRSGLNELTIPANEPGSSIMPGKVNPTQCEALTMVAVEVMGYDTAVAFAGASGSLEMNVYKPLMIFNLLQSVRIIADSCRNFREFLVEGLQPNLQQIDKELQESLMLVTALSPVIGYDKASQIAHYAFKHGLTLKESNRQLGFITSEEFDRLIDPYKMAHPGA